MKIVLTQKEVELIVLEYVKEAYDEDIDSINVSAYSSDFATLETSSESSEVPF